MADEEQERYQNSLYDLAVISEHARHEGNLVCPRCGKDYHMLEIDEDDEELLAEQDHGPYECWQTHLEMGFCDVADDDPKETTPS